jgi:methylmalonic aciduria homocystinuria type C protein
VPPRPTWNDVVPPLLARLAEAGLELWSWVPLATYNQAVDPAYAIPSPGAADAPCLVIGNGPALWPALTSALRDDATLRASPHPVDRYVERVVRDATGSLPPHTLRLAHAAPPERFAAQRLAHLAGLAHLGPAHLTIHPELGPWHALRVAIALDVPPPGPPPGPAPDPCSACERPCLRALDAAMTQAAATWEDWLAVRDACPVGREARYPEDQLRYHYTHDPGSLPGG